MHASTRPSIFVGFSQLGQMMGTAFDDNIQIQKYTTVLKRMLMMPIMNNITISQGIFRAQIPPYMMSSPAKIKMRANDRILFILLLYTIWAMNVPPYVSKNSIAYFSIILVAYCLYDL